MNLKKGLFYLKLTVKSYRVKIVLTGCILVTFQNDRTTMPILNVLQMTLDPYTAYWSRVLTMPSKVLILEYTVSFQDDQNTLKTLSSMCLYYFKKSVELRFRVFQV